MINKNIVEIDLGTLEQLKVNSVSEGKTIEYKQQLPTNSDGDKKEFLADVSSFANASGGDLIFGIAEHNGIPGNIDGVEIENIDEEIRRFENIIKDGLEPRISAITRAINISGQKFILIFRVSKSWVVPHRVIYGGHDKFYSRNSAGKYPLDTNKLRIAFNLSQTIVEQINKFKVDRIIQLIADEFPIPITGSSKIVLHLIPFEAFNPGHSIDISSVINNFSKLRPINSHGLSDRINLEGIVTFSNDAEGKAWTYSQLYRNGIIEAVEGLLLTPRREEKKIIPSVSYEEEVLKSLGEYLKLARKLGINLSSTHFVDK